MMFARKTNMFSHSKKRVIVFYRLHKEFIAACFFLIIAGFIFYYGLRGSVLSWFERRTFTPAEQQVSLNQVREYKERQVAKVIEKGDVSACDTVPDPGTSVDYKVVCRNNIALTAAMKNLDLSACDRLDDVLMPRDLCKRNVIYQSLIGGASQDICNTPSLSKDTALFCKETFWTEQAVRQDKSALCANLTTPAVVSRCKDNVFMERLVVQKNNISCDLFSTRFQSACAAFEKNQNNLKGTARCTAVHNGAFETLCLDRISIAKKLARP